MQTKGSFLMTMDKLDLKVLMDLVERYARCVSRDDNDGHEYVAQFLELVSKACNHRAAQLRKSY